MVYTDGNVSMVERFYFSVKDKDPFWCFLFNLSLNVVKKFLRGSVISFTARNVWNAAMLERIQSDATLPKATTTSPANRAELAIAPTPPSTELREKAVAPIGNIQRSSAEADLLNASARAIQQTRDGFREIHRTEMDLQELEKLYEKILPGYKALKEKSEAPALVHAAMTAAAEVDAFEARASGSKKAQGAPAPVVEPQTSTERERTLARIEAAMLKVDALRSKLTDSRASAHDRLLNINASMSGLNMARMQVSDDKIMTSLASSACETIMMNVRSVVVAHGNVSPDLVRLILN